MEARTLKMICTKSKLGHSLSQISELTGLTIDEVRERLGQATGISPEALSSILHMKQRGLSLELISQEFDVELEVLKQFLPKVIKKTHRTHAPADQGKGSYETSLGERAYTIDSPDHCRTYNKSSPATTEETEPPPQPSEMLPKPQDTPTYFYCCKYNSNKLGRVNLLTGELSCHQIPGYLFKELCRWSELPGGSLLITGDEGPKEVVKIDTLREWAVSFQPPMHTARYNHAVVYYSQYLYVLAGNYINRYLSECERYSCAESQWEVLPALPVAGTHMSAVEIKNCLYALGGWSRRELDTVQKLSLDSLTWELIQLKLPQAVCYFACFKTDTQVYLVIKETLYSFTPLQIKPVRTLDGGILCSSSYYNRGTLYYEMGEGIESLALGFN
jgi:hypothetical protein